MDRQRPIIVLFNTSITESPRLYPRMPSPGMSEALTASQLSVDVFNTTHTTMAIIETPLHDEFTMLSSGTNGLPLKTPSLSMAATTRSSQKYKLRVLGPMALVGILYFAMCGGPLGSEPLISAVGPLPGLIGLVLYVLLCQLPIANMTMELSCAFPENGGFCVWVLTAFGPFWGFQVGYWSWIASVLNNAMYPGIIYTTIAKACGLDLPFVTSFVLKVLIAICLAVPHYIGVRFVGLGVLGLLVLALVLVVVFAQWGIIVGDGAWHRLGDVRGSSDLAHWTLLIHTLFWSFDRLQLVSVIGGEVLNPERTFPRVIKVAVSLAAATYFLTWLSAVLANKMPWQNLTNGTFPMLARAIGGATLQHLVFFLSIVASIGTYVSTLFFQSFLVHGMAQSRLLPPVLRKRHAQYRTPQYATTLSLVATVALVGLDFQSILTTANALSGLMQLVVIATMIKLRRAFPHMPRPIKVPRTNSNLALGLILTSSVMLILFIIGSTLMKWKVALVVMAFAVPGLLFPTIRKRLEGATCCC